MNHELQGAEANWASRRWQGRGGHYGYRSWINLWRWMKNVSWALILPKTPFYQLPFSIIMSVLTVDFLKSEIFCLHHECEHSFTQNKRISSLMKDEQPASCSETRFLFNNRPVSHIAGVWETTADHCSYFIREVKRVFSTLMECPSPSLTRLQ